MARDGWDSYKSRSPNLSMDGRHKDNARSPNMTRDWRLSYKSRSPNLSRDGRHKDNARSQICQWMGDTKHKLGLQI